MTKKFLYGLSALIFFSGCNFGIDTPDPSINFVSQVVSQAEKTQLDKYVYLPANPSVTPLTAEQLALFQDTTVMFIGIDKYPIELKEKIAMGLDIMRYLVLTRPFADTIVHFNTYSYNPAKIKPDPKGPGLIDSDEGKPFFLDNTSTPIFSPRVNTLNIMMAIRNVKNRITIAYHDRADYVYTATLGDRGKDWNLKKIGDNNNIAKEVYQNYGGVVRSSIWLPKLMQLPENIAISSALFLHETMHNIGFGHPKSQPDRIKELGAFSDIPYGVQGAIDRLFGIVNYETIYQAGKMPKFYLNYLNTKATGVVYPLVASPSAMKLAPLNTVDALSSVTCGLVPTK